jgi:hypothetical protein
LAASTTAISTCAISSPATRSPQVQAMSADEDLFAQRRAEVLRLTATTPGSGWRAPNINCASS